MPDQHTWDRQPLNFLPPTYLCQLSVPPNMATENISFSNKLHSLTPWACAGQTEPHGAPDVACSPLGPKRALRKVTMETLDGQSSPSAPTDPGNGGQSRTSQHGLARGAEPARGSSVAAAGAAFCSPPSFLGSSPQTTLQLDRPFSCTTTAIPL